MNVPVHRRAPFSPRQQLEILGGALGFVVLLGLVVLAARSLGRPHQAPLERLSRSCRLEPVWERELGAPAPRTEPVTGARRRLAVYLDTSEPMGGFVPPSTDDATTPLARLLAVLPDHLQAAEAGPAEVTWWSVAEEVAELERPTRWTQSLFRGTQSRLRPAVTRMVRETLAGRLDLVVLVTDLAATEADTLGAMAAANAFEEQSYAARARAGDLHLGLFGVRAPYLGAVRPACGAPAGLGCRFSERLGRWAPVSRPLRAAVYFLVLGRQRSAVVSLAERLGTSAREAGLEPWFELLTEETTPREVTASCVAVDEQGRLTRQFTLAVDPAGRARCANSRIVRLLCELEWLIPAEAPGPQARSGSGPAPWSWQGFFPRGTSASWPGVSVQAANQRLDLELDCGAVRRAAPPEDLELKLSGGRATPSRPDWAPWSTETDETEASVGKTLLLSSFVERLRPVPTSYRLVCPAFLRAPEQRK